MAATPEQTDSIGSQISRLIVHTMSEYTGRGPTRAHTTINDELVTTLLHDTLTKGERSLVADGNCRMVLEMRKGFQMAMRTDLVAGVESITGRRVIAFMSDNAIDPDMSVEVFVMESDR